MTRDWLVDDDKRHRHANSWGDARNVNGKKLRKYRLYKGTNTLVCIVLLWKHIHKSLDWPIPWNERMCLYCDANVVEDEKHFLSTVLIFTNYVIKC